MKLLRRLDHTSATAETALLVFLLAVMILLDFTQVILRNLFSSGFIWGDTLLRQMVLWVAFLGASLAVQERKHIKIDVLTRFMSERGRKISRFATDLFAAIVCLAFFRAALTFVANEFVQRTTVFLDIPTWYFQVIIPVAYAMLSFRFLIKAVDDVIELRHKIPAADG